MVKTPRTRHSKSAKEPVTIDLEPDAVSRVKAETEAARDEAAPDAAKSNESARPEQEAAPKTGPEVTSDESSTTTTSDAAFGRAEPSATPAQENRKGSGALMAGVAGGAVALLLTGGLHVAGLLPLGSSAPQDDHAPAIAALEAQLADLRGQISELEGAGGDDPALAGRVAEAEERVATLDAAVEALRAEIAQLGNQPGGEAATAIAPLEERIAAVEAALGDINAAQPPQADLSAVEESIAALREEVTSTREAQAAALSRLDALEQAIARFDERLDEQAEAPATAVIIAASALKAAIDRGAPFTTELDTFASLAPEAPQVEGLRAYAAAGVATRAQLAAESNAAANAMIAAAAPVDPEAGVMDRLWASAMGLVQVRPIGMVEGDGVSEIVARLDAAVEAGDYERAIAEFATLPETAKAAGEAFMQRLEARYHADRLVDEALAAALRA